MLYIPCAKDTVENKKTWILFSWNFPYNDKQLLLY